MKAHACLTRLFALLVLFLLSAGTALAAGIKVVPSTDRVTPGENFFVDIIAENIPDEGLGTVQFRLRVDADDSAVAGVSDLNQAGAAAVYVASPLLIGAPTAVRSGLGDLFLGSHQGGNGILVIDNESFSGGSALFTYAHTNGASPPSGSGSVARICLKVGSHVAAERVRIDLTDVMLLDGGAEYPLDYNVGATVTLRCSVQVPDLSGMSLGEAQAALDDLGLSVGNVFEIDNPGNAKPLDVVLDQSVAAGAFAECESSIDLAVNHAPADVTGLAAGDLAGDDTGAVTLHWTPSAAEDAAGYRIYRGAALVKTISDPQGNAATVEGLPIGLAVSLRIAAFDSLGNQSEGVTVTATALDDVPPVLAVLNVADGAYYSTPVHPQLDSSETHPAELTATLNGSVYDWSPISADGAYTLAVSMTDVSGNSTTEKVDFTVDRTAPAISVPNVVDGAYLGAAITPAIEIDDLAGDDQQTVVTLNGQPYVPGTPIAEEGAQTLVVTATDKAGNQASLTIAFVLDLTAPTITVDAVGDGAWYKAGVTPQIEIADAHLAESNITLNGNPYVSGTLIDTEGDYQLAVSAADASGNEASRSVHFSIDLTAPVIEVAQVADGAFYNSEVVPAVTISDAALAESSLTLNGAPFLSGTPVSEEGAYTLVVTADDLAGNEASTTVNFTLDRTAPVIEVSEVAEGTFYNIAVTPAITATDSYLVETVVTLDGVPYVQGTAITAEGGHELAVTARDRAGNATNRSVVFTIDLTPPDIAIADVVGGNFYNHDLSPKITISDANIAESSCTLNGTTYLSGTPIAAEGDYTLQVSAADRAGNMSFRTVAFGIDRTAPVVTVSGIVDGAFVNGSVTPVVTVTETHPAASSLTLNGQPFVSGTTVEQEAAYVLAGTYVDLAGNRAELQLSFAIDKTAPVSNFELGDPKFQADTALYATGRAVVTLSSGDVGPAVSGVAGIAFTFDGAEPWTSYAEPFALSDLSEGSHSLNWRATDVAGNVEADRLLELVVDNSAPATTIALEGVSHQVGDRLFVSAAAAFSLTAVDSFSGVAQSAYRLDGGPWTPAASFGIAAEGEHLIEYRSADHLGNTEETRQLTVTVDTTAPVTSVAFENQSFMGGGQLLLTPASRIILSAADEQAGVAWSYYRFDDETGWRTYNDSIQVTDLAYGSHTLHVFSEDQVGNSESPRSLSFSLIGAEVEVELLNLPRVLVWTEDPTRRPGGHHGNHAEYTLDDIRSLMAQAMQTSDGYVELVTEEAAFRSRLQSGVFNVVMLLNQDVRFDPNLSNALRRAVENGHVGLLFSGGEGNLDRMLRDMFGVDMLGFIPSMSEQHEIHLFDSEVAQQSELIAYGRIRRTRLDGGVLAGIVPGERLCTGVRSVGLTYPQEARIGDRIRVSAYIRIGRWEFPVDEEEITVSGLPAGEVNNFGGNPVGDVAIAQVTADDVSFSLSGPYGYLGPNYLLAVRIEHNDGSVEESGRIPISPTCASHLMTGIHVGPFLVDAVDDDQIQITDDLPAVVLHEYGDGRTVFLGYDILASALKNGDGSHVDLLGKAASYLLPSTVTVEPAGIGLVETRVSIAGIGQDLAAVESLDAELTHLPLFGLAQSPLEYRFHVDEGEPYAYRYFLRFPDKSGTFMKQTDLHLVLDGEDIPYDRFEHGFTVPTDSGELLQQVIRMLEDMREQHPRQGRKLSRIIDEMHRIDLLPKSSASDYEVVAESVGSVIVDIERLRLDGDEVLGVLADYLRIMQALQSAALEISPSP